MVRPSCFLALVLIATSVAAAPLHVGGRQELSPRAFGDAVGGQGSSAIAYNGSIYFAVWADSRSGHTAEIYGTRITASGEVLDPLGINVSGYPAREDDPPSEPSVTWTGEAFFVAWRTIGDVYAARVIDDGTVLDTVPLLIDDAVLAGSPEVVSNGSSVLLAGGRCIAPIRAWTMHRDGSRIAELDLGLPQPTGCGAAVATDGTHYLIAIQSSGSLAWMITDDHSILARGQYLFDFAGTLAATWTGSEYVVLAGGVLANGPGLHLLRIDAAGELAGDPVLLTSYPIDSVSAAGGGGRATVMWTETLANVLPPMGVVAVVEGGAVNHQQEAGFMYGPAIAGDGTAAIAVWSEPGTGKLQHAAVSEDGTLNAPVSTTHSVHEQRMLSAVRTSAATASVWQERSGSSSPGVAFALRRDDGSAVFRNPLFDSAGARFSPVIATDGEELAVAWYEQKAALELRAARLSPTGEPIANPVTVASKIDVRFGTPWGTIAPPAIAWNGRTWLLAWMDEDRSSLKIGRLAKDGTLLDPEGIRVYTSSRGASIVWPTILQANDTSFIIFQDGDESAPCQFDPCPVIPPGRVLALRLDADARPIDAVPIEVSPGEYEIRPAAAWNGEEFLVTYIAADGVYARRLSAAGSPIGDPFRVFADEDGAFADRVSVGALGNDFLVAISTEAQSSDISVIDVNGSTAGEPVALSSGSEREAWPRVVALSRGSASVFFEGAGARGSTTASVARLYFRNVYAEMIRRRAVR